MTLCHSIWHDSYITYSEIFIFYPQVQFFLYLQPCWFLSADIQCLRDLTSLSDDRAEHRLDLELEDHRLDLDDGKVVQVGDLFGKLAHFLKHKSNRTVFEVTLEILSITGNRAEIKITLWNNASHITSFHFVTTQIRYDPCQISINFLLLSFLLQLSILKRNRKRLLSV